MSKPRHVPHVPLGGEHGGNRIIAGRRRGITTCSLRSLRLNPRGSIFFYNTALTSLPSLKQKGTEGTRGLTAAPSVDYRVPFYSGTRLNNRVLFPTGVNAHV